MQCVAWVCQPGLSLCQGKSEFHLSSPFAPGRARPISMLYNLPWDSSEQGLFLTKSWWLNLDPFPDWSRCVYKEEEAEDRLALLSFHPRPHTHNQLSWIFPTKQLLWIITKMILLWKKCRVKNLRLFDWLIMNIKDFVLVEWQIEIRCVFMQILWGWYWIGPQISAGINEMEAVKYRAPITMISDQAQMKAPRPFRQVPRARVEQ